MSKGDTFERMRKLGIDPIKAGSLMEGVDLNEINARMGRPTPAAAAPSQQRPGRRTLSESGGDYPENDDDTDEREQQEEQRRLAALNARPGARVQTESPADRRNHLRRMFAEAKLKDGPRASLMTLIESAERKIAPANEDVNTALKLVGDNAQMLSNRYWDLQESEVSNALTRLANRADALATDSTVSESVKHQHFDKFLKALSEAHANYVQALTGKRIDIPGATTTEEYDAQGRLVRRSNDSGN